MSAIPVPSRLQVGSTAAAGLEPYLPSPENPWDEQAAGHLLRRTLFGPRPAEIQYALSKTPGDIVDELLADKPFPDPPGDWAGQPPFPRPVSQEQRRQYRAWMNELREWWYALMIGQEFSIREKLTLFWHDHFATEAVKVKIPQYMYIQNDTLRRGGLGSVRDLVKAISRDPAMLIYLDGIRNRAGNPNENYAREVMELFTIGVGNYTQQDVAEAARAFTGWVIEGLESRLVLRRHDDGIKTFLGRSGNFDGDDIVDILFEQSQTAVFLCRKLYRHFVYEQADEAIVQELAQVMRDNDYQVRPVLATLLKSTHFFQRSLMGARYKDPMDFLAGTLRMLDWPGFDGNLPRLFRRLAEQLQMSVLDPPNVAGWPGYRSWISTTTLPLRNFFTDRIVDGRRLPYKVDTVAYARSFAEPNDAEKLITDMATHLLPLPVTDKQKEMLLETLLQGAALYDWYVDDPSAPGRLERTLKTILRMAEFQLS